jgi:AcrR family transcriptional regulator
MADTLGSARALARASVISDIKAAARRQVAEHGAASLSVRLVARDLGMSSSAVYRYFASRDELLTSLIIDAYDDLGSTVEAAEARVPRDKLDVRLLAAAISIRAWAVANRHEYALVFGSPVPGYAAPEATIGPAIRVPAVFSGILRDAWEQGRLVSPVGPAVASLDPAVHAPPSPLAGLPDAVIVRGILAWTQIFGLISFELFGHLVRSVEDGAEFFESACKSIARSIGITGDTD